MKEGNAGAIVERPAQCNFSRFARGEFCNDRAVSCDRDVNRDVGLALYVDDLAANLRLLPAFRREVLTSLIEILDINIFERRRDVGKPPGHATIMTDDHIWETRQGHASDVEISGV